MPWIAALLSLTLFLAPTKSAQRLPDLEALYQAHAPRVVYIRATHRDGDEITVNSGAGVVLDTGYVLATCHSFELDSADGSAPERIETAEIIFGSRDRSGMFRVGERMGAKVIRCDSERDLALLRPDKKLRGRKAVRIAKADPKPGARISALGPAWSGYPWTIRDCTVAGIGRPNRHATEIVSALTPKHAERTAATMNRRTMVEATCADHPLSGSPLLDPDGRVVGLLQYSRFNTNETVPRSWFFYLAPSEIRAFLAE